MWQKRGLPPTKGYIIPVKMFGFTGRYQMVFIIFYKKTFFFFFFVLCIRMTASDNSLDFVKRQESSVGFLPILNIQIYYFIWTAVCRTEFGPFQPF